MKINFTKKQFRILLDLVYAGNWVINATAKTDDERSKDYDELVNYIFSFCDKFGMFNFVEYDHNLEKYFETKEFEESGIMDYIESYDDYVFWDELGRRLAKRDVDKECSGKVDKSNYEKVLKRTFEVEEKYSNEFIKNGLENVKVEFQE